MNGKEAEKFYRPTEFFVIGEDKVLEDAYYEARTLKGQINHYLKEKNLKINTLAVRIDMEAKQISRYSSGERTPDRMTVIKLGLGMLLDLENINRLLSSAGFAGLSYTRKEDTIIMERYDEIIKMLEKNDNGINYEFLMELDAALSEAGCATLFMKEEK